MMKMTLPFHHQHFKLAKRTLSVLCLTFIMFSTIWVSSLITLAPQHMRYNPYSSGVISDIEVELAMPHCPACLRCRVTVNCCFCCHLVVLAFVLRCRCRIINASDLRILPCGRLSAQKQSACKDHKIWLLNISASYSHWYHYIYFGLDIFV